MLKADFPSCVNTITPFSPKGIEKVSNCPVVGNSIRFTSCAKEVKVHKIRPMNMRIDFIIILLGLK
jgi:hypothetical protein